MNTRRFDAQFEDLDGHRSVVVRWEPSSAPRGRVLFVPAFGDEMNQTRRMVRLTAETLADRGIASCIFDLYGTGDSSADFADATVERWVADCRRVVELLDAASADNATPLLLIGCRLGGALAVRVSHELARKPAALIAWAPIFHGRQQLSALLRAASIARMQHHGESGADPKALWAQDRIATLAGYPISPKLAEQLEALDGTGTPFSGSARLFDVRLPVGDQAIGPSESLAKRAIAWSEQGVPTVARAVAGPAFWNVAELVDVPELVAATVDSVAQAAGLDCAEDDS